MRLKIFFLALLFPLLSVSKEVELAYSKLLQVKAYKVFPQEESHWCQAHLNIALRSENKEFFDSISQFLKKFSKVLDLKCPEAISATLKGYIKDETTPIFEEKVYALDGWEITEQEKSSTSLALQNFTQNTPATFAVNGWIPKEDKTKFKNEYVLKDKKGTCQISYLSPIPVPKGWYFTYSNASCDKGILEGKAVVQIYTQNDILYQTLSSNLEKGLAQEGDLSLPFVKRSFNTITQEEKGYVLFHSNPELKLYSLIELRAPFLAGTYQPFTSCSPFKLFYLTENESLFTDETIRKNLIILAKSYANTVCPFLNEFYVYGVNSSDLKAENAFYSLHLFKNEKGEWAVKSQVNKASLKAQNFEKEQSALDLKLQAQYDLLFQKSLREQMAALVDGKQLNDFDTLLAKAELLERPVVGTFIFKLPEEEQSRKWISSPRLPIRIENAFGKKGWGMAKLELTSLSKKEKMKAGVPIYQRGAKAKIISFHPCVKESCKEFEDLIYLLEVKYNHPTWKPKTGLKCEK